jgi:hypothetical protein
MYWNRHYRLAACAVIAAGAFAGGCGSASNGPGVASTGSHSSTPGGSTTASGHGSPLAYSRCMRTHGVPNFPDPTPQGNGGFSISLPHGVDPRSPQFQAADQACKSSMPGGHFSPAQQQQAMAAGLRMSQCMRAHGIKDFPDPNSQGGIGIKVTPGSDLDPNNPQFKAANAACQHLMPGPKNGVGPRVDSSGSGGGSAMGSAGGGG